MSPGVPDPSGPVDPQDIMLAGLFEPVAELGVGSVDRVRQHPPCRDLGLESPLQHDPGEPALGGEAHVLRHTGLRPSLGGVGPLVGQVQLPIDEGRALLGSVSQEDADWQFSLLPAVPVYWRFTPTLFSPFFRKPVSSTIRTPLPPSPRCSTTYSRRSSRTASASQREPFKIRCVLLGCASPMASATCQPFLRRISASSPVR